MDALLIMLKNVIVFVLLAVPGYILIKAGKLKENASGALSTMLLYVGVPFLVMSSTMNNITFDKKLLLTLLLATVISVGFTLIMFFATKPLSAHEKNEKTRGMLRFAAMFSNNGFLGIPLAMAVFGEGSEVLTVLIVMNIVTNIFLFTLGIYLISGDKKTISAKKALLNPVLIAFVVGIILNLIKAPSLLPEIKTYSAHLSGIVTPISMTVLGMKMGGVKLLSIFKSKKLYYASLLKLVVFPALITALLVLLARLGASVINEGLIMGTFIAFSMPTAGLSTTFSDSYDGDTENAVVFTLGTTVLSVVTIPVLYYLVNIVLGI